MHGARTARPPDDDHLLVTQRFGYRLIGIVLQPDLFAATQTLVGRDYKFRLAVGDATGQRVRREAAEHHRVDGADPRAGEHGVGRLGDHRQIDGDTVAAFDAHR